MKKVMINILTILVILLPILGAGSKVLFEICVILWPFFIIILLILKIKNKKLYKNGEKYYSDIYSNKTKKERKNLK
ncbi:MAG: hypothetical protein J6N78_04045 [Clostridia bacterium]|nr:hypothetical protein [Clostridia bacterium]